MKGLVDQLAGAGADADETTRRILDAAREELEQHGLRRANVEQIAKRAGISRMTLYRRFDGKTELLGALVARDLQEFAAAAIIAWGAGKSIEDRTVELFVLSIRSLRSNQLLQRMLQSEPETILPLLTLESGSLFELYRGLMGGVLQTAIDAGDLPELDVDLATELLFRLMISLTIIPVGSAPGETDAELERFARRVILPALKLPLGAD